jgi:hypothetical protein
LPLVECIVGPQSQQLEICQLIEVLAWSITEYKHSLELPTSHILEIMTELAAVVLVNPEFECLRFRFFSKLLALPRNFEACHWSVIQARQYFDLAWPQTFSLWHRIPSEPDNDPERLLAILHVLVVIKDCDIEDIAVLCNEIARRTPFFTHITQLLPETLAREGRLSGWDAVHSTRLIIRLEALLKRLADDWPVLLRVGNLIGNVISYSIQDTAITGLMNQIHQREVGHLRRWPVRPDNVLGDYLSIINEVKYWVAQRIPLPDDANRNQNRISQTTDSERYHLRLPVTKFLHDPTPL